MKKKFQNCQKSPLIPLFQRGKSFLDTLEIALLANGVSPDKLYPLDVDRAFDLLTSPPSGDSV